ncbi:MAG: hypothetical protein KAG28_02755 [Cocleimonas sp.]|nr:hypothetical protein [Cocleimonas sp.]
MNSKIILFISLSLFTFIHATESITTTPSNKSNDWYVGVNSSMLNSGGSVLLSNGRKTETYDIETKDSPILLKIGSVSDSKNRTEIYYKKDSFNTATVKDIFKTSTVGLNYQWGITSLSSEKILPYLRMGGGIGSASMKGDNDHLELGVVELDMGAGIHYKIVDNISLSAGLYRRAIILGEDKTNNSVGTGFNGVEVGVNYHFLDLKRAMVKQY